MSGFDRPSDICLPSLKPTAKSLKIFPGRKVVFQRGAFSTKPVDILGVNLLQIFQSSDHPRTCKCLVYPHLQAIKKVMWKGTFSPSLGGQKTTITMEKSTTEPSCGMILQATLPNLPDPRWIYPSPQGGRSHLRHLGRERRCQQHGGSRTGGGGSHQGRVRNRIQRQGLDNFE